MAERAKRFYLCNLIPLCEIDEENMDVDWPGYHAYFNDLIEMRADIKKRSIRWTSDNGVTVAPDLKIRFEVYESDFLLSGGRNDWMGTFSSHKDYGDDVTVRPIKIVDDFDKVPEDEREKHIFIHSIDPETLQVRCWWKVTEEEGGDVSGNPEYYYDILLEGKTTDGKSVKLEERSDHELTGFNWYVTDKVRSGRVSPIVDGEYVFLKMLQLLDSAQHTIHIAAWSFDMHTALAVSHEFQADYLQIPGLDAPAYKDLLVRNKPRPNGVACSPDAALLVYTASNGNVSTAKRIDRTTVTSVVQQTFEATPFEEPTGLAIAGIDASGARILVLDARTHRLGLLIEFQRKNLRMISDKIGLVLLGTKSGVNIFGVAQIVEPLKHTLLLQRAVAAAVAAGKTEPEIVTLVEELPVLVLVFLAGGGAAGFGDLPGAVETQPFGKIFLPSGVLNAPQGVVIVPDGVPAAIPGRVFITDTGNHCIRLFKWDSMQLTTFAGDPVPGNKDGVGRAAQFKSPTGITWDSKAKRLLVADTGNGLIRAIRPDTAAVTTLNVSTVDGKSVKPGPITGLAFDADHGPEGMLYASEPARHRILAIDLKTMAATTLAGSDKGESGYLDDTGNAARFNTPGSLSYAFDSLYVADEENRVVRRVDVVGRAVDTFGVKDEPGPQDMPITVADVLRRKAKEGVEVRVLLDSIQNKGAFEDAAALNKLHENIHAFVQFHVQAFGETEEPNPKDPATSLASFHDKMIVVDSRAGFTGGLDFGSQKNNSMLHESYFEGNMFWHDQAALVEGQAALGLEEHFIWRWNLLRKELRISDAEYERDEIPAMTTTACFTMFRRHYENERLELDASCSRPTAFQDLKEYRWQFIQKFRYDEAVKQDGQVKEVPRVRDVPLLTATVPYAQVELPRKLDPGEYNIKLTVKSSGGGEDSVEHKLEVVPARPDDITVVDRTDKTIQDHQAESVRTWDPSPVFINVNESEVHQVLESYRRGILAARHYVYMEHQYIFYPEIGEYLETAMKENPRLQVIWVIPFFTEETQDPYTERRLYKARKQFISATPQLLSLSPGIDFLLSIGRGGGAHGQIKSQLAWHGFFRQHEMVEKLRKVDAKRFGVFSMRRVFAGLNIIYPHSKMILCDDRFFSIGSANANGRGFVKDSEHNISALSPTQAKKLRVRLWGELLGYVGVAAVAPGGELFITAGHHLHVGDKIRLQHQSFGEEERTITDVHDDKGTVEVDGSSLDPALGRVLWTDPRIQALLPRDAMAFWRDSSHTIDTYRKVQGVHATSDSSGQLVVPNHLAEKDDVLNLGMRVIQLDDAGLPRATGGLIIPVIGGPIKVLDKTTDVIKLDWPARQRIPNVAGGAQTWVMDIALGASKDIPPFKVTVKARNADASLIEYRLLPNQKDVGFDYTESWLKRQPASTQLLRTWEIDPPEGIEYGGPGSWLRWPLWPITDIDPDEHARLQGLASDVRLA
jgi:phosphatidylserine/phosphatidylglycerophosphate/cardiolipin synthase-like enzyme/DNA-binding beta-propeller fold protein YncE